MKWRTHVSTKMISYSMGCNHVRMTHNYSHQDSGECVLCFHASECASFRVLHDIVRIIASIYDPAKGQEKHLGFSTALLYKQNIGPLSSIWASWTADRSLQRCCGWKWSIVNAYYGSQPVILSSWNHSTRLMCAACAPNTIPNSQSLFTTDCSNGTSFQEAVALFERPLSTSCCECDVLEVLVRFERSYCTLEVCTTVKVIQGTSHHSPTNRAGHKRTIWEISCSIGVVYAIRV